MSAAPIQYRVSASDIQGHRFTVRLRIARPAARQQVSLPVWIPGSYLVREFSKNLLQLQARQGQQVLAVQQNDKCTWTVACTPGKALDISYEVYAFDHSVRTAWLDATRGFFNGTSLCLAVEGQTHGVHELTLVADKAMSRWSVATGLAPHQVNPRGFGSYRAANYDELVDCPVEMGPFWQGEFEACGVPHQFVVAGVPPSFDGERLLADTRKICETAIRFWHARDTTRNGGKRLRSKPPHQRYVFMLNAVDDNYGGLEHRNSTALICNRRDLPRQASDLAGKTQPEGYTTLLGLISHEYFHTWNVKRLRPAEFAQYQYNKENYTELLWFFEGFTSYYDDLLLRRAGLLDNAGYLKLLAKTINQVAQTPGRAVQSVAQSSFDAWVKYYRADENTPNATVSYYTKGALVALCFDLTLRAGRHDTSLDDVMRALWARCKAGPMTEADFLSELAACSGRPFDEDVQAWVHGVADLPVKRLLEAHGISVTLEPVALAQQLGLRLSEASGISVKQVLRGGLAEQAGFAAGDEWLAVGDWRLNKLEDLALYAGQANEVSVLIARDRQLQRLRLRLPPGTSTAPRKEAADNVWSPNLSWRLVVRDAAQVEAWLAP